MTFITSSADAYDRVRPTYDQRVVKGALAHLDVTTTLELAAGTGKLTEHLVGRTQLVCSEPDSAMALELKQRYPQIRVEPWTAEESLDNLGREISLVTAA